MTGLRNLVAIKNEFLFEFVEGSPDMWTVTFSKWEEDDMEIGRWVPYTVTHFLREDAVREFVDRLEKDLKFHVCD